MNLLSGHEPERAAMPLPIPARDATVVITGASAGIGRAAARAFARRGCRLALIARDQGRLDAAARDVEDLGGRALTLSLDVADAAAVEEAAAAAEEAFGPIAVWVNCAMATVYSRAADMSPEEFQRVTEVTYLGCVHGTLAALRRMDAQGFGTIVQVGSSQAYRGLPLQSAYCAAEFALRGFTDSLRGELIHDTSPVRLTMVQLPAVNTPQFDWARNRLPRRPQPVPPVYQPEMAAEAIVHAAERAPRELWVDTSTVKVIAASLAAPGLMDHLVAEAARQGDEGGPPDSPGRPDNLFAPVPGNWGAHGRFDDRARDEAPWFAEAGVRLAAALAGGVIVAAALGIGLAGWRRLAGTRPWRPLFPAMPKPEEGTMANTRAIIKDWLKDAHAMEGASIDSLSKQMEYLDDYPELKAKWREQIDLTRQQQRRIDEQLRAMGEDASTVRDAMTRMAGRVQAVLAGASPDEVVKQATNALAYENWEIANYRALAAAAEREGEHSMRSVFEEMANEKIDMMNWLVDALPAITQRYLDIQAGQ